MKRPKSRILFAPLSPYTEGGFGAQPSAAPGALLDGRLGRGIRLRAHNGSRAAPLVRGTAGAIGGDEPSVNARGILKRLRGWRVGRASSRGPERPECPGNPAVDGPARDRAVRAWGWSRRSPRFPPPFAMLPDAGKKHPDSGDQQDHDRLQEPVVAAIGNARVEEDGVAAAHARSSRKNSLTRRARSASVKRRSVSTITGSSR